MLFSFLFCGQCNSDAQSIEKRELRSCFAPGYSQTCCNVCRKPWFDLLTDRPFIKTSIYAKRCRDAPKMSGLLNTTLKLVYKPKEAVTRPK